MKLDRLGLDVVHIGADAVEVQLHSARDERRLRASGYDARVLIANTDRHNNRARAAEARREASGLASALPTGRVSYRTLAEINAELEHQTAKDTTEGPPKPLGTRGAKMADTIGKAQR